MKTNINNSYLYYVINMDCKYMYGLLLILLFFSNIHSFRGLSNRFNGKYRQFYLKDKFQPVLEEKTVFIKHENNLFNQLNNSFYAQIGSNPKHVKDEDYHWFDGDGMIHGLFIKEGHMMYQNRWVQTKRLQVEDKWKKKIYLYLGELKGLNGLVQIFKYSMLELLGFVPRTSGTANTAFMNWNNKIYALHEGDMPYELNIDYKNYNISTIKRLNYNSVFSTTAHPIANEKKGHLYLYGYNNYDFNNGKFIFNVFDKQMNLLNQKNISLINNGMIHDVGYINNYMIIPDMPLKYDINRIFKEKLPIYFDKEKGETRFGVLNIKKETVKWYNFKDNFFIFHFAKVRKTSHKFIIYACVMEELFVEDFIDVNNINNKEKELRGKLRLKEIHLDIYRNKTNIVTNPFIEDLNIGFSYNLDFPVQSKLHESKIYMSIFNAKTGYISGYILIDTNNFQYKKPEVFLFCNETHGNCEPQVVIIDENEYLLTFTNDNSTPYISLVDIKNNNLTSVPIPTRIPPGFHSIHYKY